MFSSHGRSVLSVDNRPRLASLWIGNSLSGIEQLSAQSFLDHDNALTLYSYEEVSNVPAGVEIRDAREIFDAGRILRHEGKGSPAIHADLFRYQMLAKTDQIWVDLDMVALRPFAFSSPHVYGWENADQVNNAVLGLPAQSQTLRRLLKMTPETVAPAATVFQPWWRSWIPRLRGYTMPIEDWPWGTTGPMALTHHLRHSGEISHALPPSAFYPIGWQEMDKLIKAGQLTLDDLRDSYGIHLWGKFIRQALQQTRGHPEEGSVLDQLLKRHRVSM